MVSISDILYLDTRGAGVLRQIRRQCSMDSLTSTMVCCFALTPAASLYIFLVHSGLPSEAVESKRFDHFAHGPMYKIPVLHAFLYLVLFIALGMCIGFCIRVCESRADELSERIKIKGLLQIKTNNPFILMFKKICL